MKKILRTLFSYEPLLVYFRYFFVTKVKYNVINFLIPLIACLLLGFLAEDKVIASNINYFTICSILLGFVATILVMLFTLPKEIKEKLNDVKMGKTTYGLHQALIYKFSFIAYNMTAIIILNLIANLLQLSSNIYVILFSIGFILNSLLILIEALSNTIFCLMNG